MYQLTFSQTGLLYYIEHGFHPNGAWSKQMLLHKDEGREIYAFQTPNTWEPSCTTTTTP